MSLLKHTKLHLKPDARRTVIRRFDPQYPGPFADKGPSRTERIVASVLAMDDRELAAARKMAVVPLQSEHRNVDRLLLRRYDEIVKVVPDAAKARDAAKLVIGAYFSEEYSFEAAALFNPSIVLHPDAEPDFGRRRVRFLLSLRGIGEGHISSVTFRTGTWSAESGFSIDEVSENAVSPQIEDADAASDGVTRIMCDGSENPSESVLFPVTPSQRQGIEDLRLCRFVEEDGSVDYLGTYTAFDGRNARSEMLRITDLKEFEMRPLAGSAAQAKGMALFPRRIDGRYVMLGRQDNENIWLLRSDDLYTWDGGDKLIEPQIRLGLVPDGQLRVADRDRRGLAGADPRRRPGPHLLHGRGAARQGRSVEGARAHAGADPAPQPRGARRLRPQRRL